MSHAKNWFQWLDKNNKKQQQWALNYLSEKKVRQLSSPSNHPQQEMNAAIGNAFATPAEQLLFIKKMRSAWSQKKFRDKKNGKKSYNFVMDTGIKNQLDTLAKQHNKPINETIKLLIQRGFNYEKTAKAENLEQKRKAKAESEKIRDQLSKKSVSLEDHNKVVAELDKLKLKHQAVLMVFKETKEEINASQKALSKRIDIQNNQSQAQKHHQANKHGLNTK